jgi:DNA-binding transcriptional LysR family regulator
LGSLTRAAVILKSAPSAVSRQISALARECGRRRQGFRAGGIVLLAQACVFYG